MESEGMSVEEQRTWAYGICAVFGLLGYLAMLLARRSPEGIAETAYVAPMSIAIAGSVIAGIVANIVIGMRSDDAGTDVRDDQLYRQGEYAGHWVLVAGAIGALILAVREVDWFWISQTIYLAFVGSAIVSSVVRIAGYRRGFAPW